MLKQALFYIAPILVKNATEAAEGLSVTWSSPSYPSQAIRLEHVKVTSTKMDRVVVRKLKFWLIAVASRAVWHSCHQAEIASSGGRTAFPKRMAR